MVAAASRADTYEQDLDEFSEDTFSDFVTSTLSATVHGSFAQSHSTSASSSLDQGRRDAPSVGSQHREVSETAGLDCNFYYDVRPCPQTRRTAATTVGNFQTRRPRSGLLHDGPLHSEALSTSLSSNTSGHTSAYNPGPYTAFEASQQARQNRVPAAVSSPYAGLDPFQIACQQLLSIPETSNSGVLDDGGWGNQDDGEALNREDNDEAEDNIEDDEDHPVTNALLGKTASEAKSSGPRQPKARGEARQPKKSCVPPLFTDEVLDQNGNIKPQYTLDVDTNNLFLSSGKLAASNTTRRWKDHQLSPDRFLYELGYFAGNPKPKHPGQMGKELLTRYENAQNRQFWPSTNTDNYGRNIINKAEPTYLKRFLHSHLPKGDPRIQTILDRRPENHTNAKNGLCHGLLSTYGLHWTPPFGSTTASGAQVPSTDPGTQVHQQPYLHFYPRPRPTRQRLRPSKRLRRPALATSPDNDSTTDTNPLDAPSLGQATAYTDARALPGHHEQHSAPIAPMMGSEQSKSDFAYMNDSGNLSKSGRNFHDGNEKRPLKRKTREEDEFPDAGDNLRARAVKLNKHAHVGQQKHGITDREQQNQLASNEKTTAQASPGLQSVYHPSSNLQRFGVGISSRPSNLKRKAVDESPQTDGMVGNGGYTVKKQKVASSHCARQDAATRHSEKRPDKRDSGYSSQMESSKLPPPMVEGLTSHVESPVDQAERQQDQDTAIVDDEVDRDLISSEQSLRNGASAVRPGTFPPDRSIEDLGFAADNDDPSSVAVNSQPVNDGAALAQQDQTNGSSNQQVWFHAHTEFDSLAAQLAAQDTVGNLSSDDLEQLYYTVSELDQWTFFLLYMSTPFNTDPRTWLRRSQYYQWRYVG